jgi:hypothetical protein
MGATAMTDHEYSSIDKAARALAQKTIDRQQNSPPTLDVLKKENTSAGKPGACTSHINLHCSFTKDHEGLHRVVGTRLAWSNQIEAFDIHEPE